MAVRQIPLWRFLLATALVFISRFFVVGRWHVLLRSAEMDIPFSRSVALTFTGLFAANFLPTTIGGDVVRFAGAVEMGYSSTLILASLVADRLIGMAGMAMVLPSGFGGALVHSDRQNGAGDLPGWAVGKRKGFCQENLRGAFGLA